MTTAEAREAGYEITRGSYSGTSDDNIDRWYIQRIDTDTVDRRGYGYPTRKDALLALEEYLGTRRYLEQSNA